MAKYLRDPDTGEVYLESDNPQAYWTTEEWAAEVKRVAGEVETLEALIAQVPKPKDQPDQECLDFWNMMIAGPMYGGGMADQLQAKQAELDEMKAV